MGIQASAVKHQLEFMEHQLPHTTENSCSIKWLVKDLKLKNKILIDDEKNNITIVLPEVKTNIHFNLGNKGKKKFSPLGKKFNIDSPIGFLKNLEGKTIIKNFVF